MVLPNTNLRYFCRVYDYVEKQISAKTEIQKENLGDTMRIILKSSETYNNLYITNWYGISFQIEGYIAIISEKCAFAPTYCLFRYQ